MMLKAIYLNVILLLNFRVIASSQSLPNVQKNSLRPPSNIKIDGKSIEWENGFQAYNRATNLHYTLSNDDTNIYLVIKASDPDVLSKITNRGIFFAINPTGKKTNEGAFTITYPFFDLKYGGKPFIRFSNASGLTPTQRLAMNSNPDSMLRVANRKLHDNEKYIRTGGMPGVDTLISVYNDQDILAREGFEKGMIYIYELALPLKYLKSASGDLSKFAYHIVLQGLNIDQDFGMKSTTLPNGEVLVTFAQGASTIMRDHMPAVVSTTDFWGEYKLAK